MIRPCKDSDIESILDIWLQASIQAHDFIAPTFWQSQVDNMRTLYLPASETYVLERNSEVVGFYALHDNTLAAIFVRPELQRQGIGKLLLDHAKTKRPALTLSVYTENDASYRFYLAQGFTVVSQQTETHTGHLEYTMVSNTA
ncbi:N-acetyltransferase [Marinobacterium marinum]|uniref:N-acetyltransferase n=1 Tax=Marinobacterium marinum TaxID=2756129 RepID=A0A7W2AB86_9GAMM|nr:N-acetyltransferase [Marinobacterium marinum]MBA4502691.1 N-acetyltransferase [Marinobacterium marinum]